MAREGKIRMRVKTNGYTTFVDMDDLEKTLLNDMGYVNDDIKAYIQQLRESLNRFREEIEIKYR